MSAMDQLARYTQALGDNAAAAIARADAAAAAIRPIWEFADWFSDLFGFLWEPERGRWKAALYEANRLRALAIEADAFRASEPRRFLDAAWANHPLLFSEPAPDSRATHAAASIQIHSERHTVERQVVVVTCKYCQKLTPVDHASCDHCGAAGFGSSQAGR
jgi:hypothetical protein